MTARSGSSVDSGRSVESKGPSRRKTRSHGSSEGDEDTVSESEEEKKEVTTNVEKTRIFDRRVHKARDSLFSTTSGYNNYRGFLNLCIVLLVSARAVASQLVHDRALYLLVTVFLYRLLVLPNDKLDLGQSFLPPDEVNANRILSNARLLLENIIKYGILIDPLQWVTIIFADPHRWPCITICLASNIFILIALKLEQKLLKGSMSEKTGVGLQIANLAAVLIFPAFAVWYSHSYLVAACSTMVMYCCVFFKLTSYVMVNRWYRLEAKGLIPHRQFRHPEHKDHHNQIWRFGLRSLPAKTVECLVCRANTVEA